MICEHYWRDGILLVERDEPDPHRDTCAVCRREHEVREQIIRALPLVGRETAGDPHWEARVWSRIARLESRRPAPWWRLAAGLTAAFAIVVVWWTIARRQELRPRIEVVPGDDAIAMRSELPRVGDRVQIAVELTDEVRIYRGDDLVLRCPAGSTGDGCRSDAHGMVAEARLAASGNYRLVVITLATAEPVGRLDLDLGAVVAAGGEYQITELSVP